MERKCIACQNESAEDNFPASFRAYDGRGIICFDCIRANVEVEIDYDVCRRCHTSDTTYFGRDNFRCKKCVEEGIKVMKRLRNGMISINEAVVMHPYMKYVQNIYNNEIFGLERQEILSIDQGIIDDMFGI